MQAILNKRYKVNALRHKLILTKEHGSWAVLAVPVLTGALAAENLKVTIIPLVLSLFFLFMSYTPAEIILQEYLKQQRLRKSGTKSPHLSGGKLSDAKYWFSIFFVTAILMGLISVVVLEKLMLLAFALAAIILFIIDLLIVIKAKKNFLSDFLAMTGLTLSAPAVIYYLDNSFSSKSLYLWLFNIIFFGSSAAYVHMKMKFAALKKKDLSLKEKLFSGRLNLLYHIIVISLVILFIIEYPLRQLAIASVMPAFIHAIAGTFILPEKTSFKKIGIIYVIYSVIFTIFTALAFRQ